MAYFKNLKEAKRFIKKHNININKELNKLLKKANKNLFIAKLLKYLIIALSIIIANAFIKKVKGFYVEVTSYLILLVIFLIVVFLIYKFIINKSDIVDIEDELCYEYYKNKIDILHPSEEKNFSYEILNSEVKTFKTYYDAIKYFILSSIDKGVDGVIIDNIDVEDVELDGKEKPIYSTKSNKAIRVVGKNNIKYFKYTR